MSLSLQTQLHQRLLTLSFHAYEQCLRDLLSAMGYKEVILLSRTRTRQYTRHGGRDMEAIAHTGVTTARIVVQVKQYQRPVSRRFADELRGTVLRLGARQGLLITTSTFSAVARQAADTPIAPVQLLDGEVLTALLIQHRIGVRASSRKPPGSLHLDRAYFDALQVRYPETKGTRPAPVAQTVASQAPCLPDIQPSRPVLVSSSYPQKGGSLLWRTHVFAGINTLWVYRAIPGTITPENVLILAILAAFGALLPDLDAAESKIRSLSVSGVQPFAPLGAFVHRVWGHRGFLHSIEAIVLFGMLLVPVALHFGLLPVLSFWGGFISHLLLDALTPAGIPWRAGIWKRLHLLPAKYRIPTGSSAEELLLAVLLVGAFLLVFSLLRDLLLTPLS